MDIAAIFFLRDSQVAGGRALLDRSEQARAKPAPFFLMLVDIERAGAEFEDFLQHLDRSPQSSRAGKGAIELRAAGMRLARQFDPRKILAHENLEIREALVVFERAVELRLHVFDEPGLDQQGIDLAFGRDKVDIVNFLYEVGRAAIIGGRLEKIAAGSGPQILRLADVDHHPGGVFHDIDAGRLRKLPDFRQGMIEAADCSGLARSGTRSDGHNRRLIAGSDRPVGRTRFVNRIAHNLKFIFRRQISPGSD